MEKNKNQKNKNNNDLECKKKLKDNEQEIKNLKKIINELEKLNKKNISEFKKKAENWKIIVEEKINNTKKQLELHYQKKEMENTKYSIQKLMEDLLPSILNLTMAINAGKNNADKNVQSFVIGFEMLKNNMVASLGKFGLKVINPKVGEKFNPKLHEVVNGKNLNVIKKVVSIGYKLHDRTIIPSKIEV